MEDSKLISMTGTSRSKCDATILLAKLVAKAVPATIKTSESFIHSLMVSYL